MTLVREETYLEYVFDFLWSENLRRMRKALARAPHGGALVLLIKNENFRRKQEATRSGAEIAKACVIKDIHIHKQKNIIA